MSSLGEKLTGYLCSMGAYRLYCSGYQVTSATQITHDIVFTLKMKNYI